jgi:hypothetical protein
MGSAWQTACIQSWKASGFKVTSLNNPNEIGVLQSHNTDVAFFAIPANHALPHITDFIEAAMDSGNEVVGIINADCMLVPQVNLIKHLARLNGVVIAERINLDRATLRPTGQLGMGFDAFFFDTKALSKISRDDRWRIGDTCWDYWFPLAFQAAGLELKTLPAPVLVHLDHDRTWDEAMLQSSLSQLMDFVRTRLRDPILITATKPPELVQPEDIDRFPSIIYQWLKSREPLWRPQDGGVDDLTIQFLNAIATRPPVTRGRALVRKTIDALRLQPIINLLGLS